MGMTPSRLLPLLAVAATAAAVVPATGALAATQPATSDSIKIVSGYAYYDAFKPNLNKKVVVVVVKTDGQLPRRFDGLVRAGGTFAQHGGGSIGSVARQGLAVLHVHGAAQGRPLLPGRRRLRQGPQGLAPAATP